MIGAKFTSFSCPNNKLRNNEIQEKRHELVCASSHYMCVSIESLQFNVIRYQNKYTIAKYNTKKVERIHTNSSDRYVKVASPAYCLFIYLFILLMKSDAMYLLHSIVDFIA